MPLALGSVHYPSTPPAEPPVQQAKAPPGTPAIFGSAGVLLFRACPIFSA
nr:MAG TPA: hypothetical protein [Caudoviricetes sp.]